MPDEPRRILMIRLSSLGDVVHNLPLLHALRDRFGRARLTWVVEARYADLLEAEPDLDAVLPVTRGSGGRGAAGLRDAMRRVRAEAPDVVLDPQGLLKSAALAFASRARVRIGHAPPEARECAHLAYTRRVPLLSHETHAVDRGLALLRGLGLEPPATPRLDLAVSEDDRADAATLVEHAFAREAEGPLVLVHPAARWDTKRWRPDRWASTIRALRRDGARVAVTVGPADEAVVRAIERDLGARLVRIRTPRLGVLAGVLARADCVVGVDSGPLHMAVALGRRVVMLYGPTDPARVGPYGRPDAVLRRPVHCAPCRRRACPPHQCMEALSVDRVVRAARDSVPA